MYILAASHFSLPLTKTKFMLVFELRWLRASHPRIVNHLKILYEIGSLHARARARCLGYRGTEVAHGAQACRDSPTGAFPPRRSGV